MVFRIVLIVISLLANYIPVEGQQGVPQEHPEFEFVFLTDIHITPRFNAVEGFQMAINKVNQLNPDFVITGGDLVYDALRGNRQHCDSLFLLYKKLSSNLKMPVYNCIGNHDLFAVYEESPEDENHPDYKYGMFERHFGDTYYSFEHKGWYFIVLNSLEVTSDKRYKGFINDEQIEWLENELTKIDESTPVVLITHIPLITTWYFVNGGTGTRTVENSAEVFSLFQNYNLRLVLQGHIHWKESGFVNDRFNFITGGSVAGNGWKGRRHNTPEGFLRVQVKDDAVSWEYMDYGWEEERLRNAK